MKLEPLAEMDRSIASEIFQEIKHIFKPENHGLALVALALAAARGRSAAEETHSLDLRSFMEAGNNGRHS